MRQIMTILARHGFGWFLNRARIAEAVGIPPIESNLGAETPKSPTPVRIRVAIEELGPTFIKLGQLLSTRPDILPADVVGELERLQDDVPPMAFSAVQERIEADLGGAIDDLFLSFDREPLASASIAQVHRASITAQHEITDHGAPPLASEQPHEVVVKVLRPDIEDCIQSDLSIMHFFAARAAAMVPELQLIDPVGIVHEFERAMSQELSFHCERNNIARFARNFADFEGVHVPTLYPELCTGGVIVMEYIDGIKITECHAMAGIDPSETGSRLLRSLLKMVLNDGFFHGDLHPGNVLVQANGDIVFIDFGLCGRLLPRQRERVIELLFAIGREDYERVSDVLFHMGTRIPGVEYNLAAFQNDVVEVLENHLFGKTLSGIDVQALFGELIAGALRHNIRMPPQNALVFKAMMTVEGLGRRLAPELNFVEEMTPVVQDLILERYSPERLARDAADIAANLSGFLRELSHTAPQMLQDLRNGHLVIKTDIQRLDELVAGQARAARMVARAVLATGAGICGTLMLDHGPPVMLGLPLPSVVAFGALIAFLAPLLPDLLRR